MTRQSGMLYHFKFSVTRDVDTLNALKQRKELYFFHLMDTRHIHVKKLIWFSNSINLSEVQNKYRNESDEEW